MGQGRGPRIPALRALLLLVLVVAGYSLNGRTVGAGDTAPARYLPISLLREADFDLDEFPFLRDEAARDTYPLLDGLPYFLRRRDGHHFSAYPPWPGVLAVPVYVLPVLAGVPDTSPLVAHLEKLAAAVITAVSVAVLFLAASATTTPGWAAIVAGVCAFGTSSLSISGQALWQHGPGQLFLALFLYLVVVSGGSGRRLAWAGLALGAAAAVRATNLLAGLPLAAMLLAREPRAAARFGLLAAVPLALHVGYGVVHFGALGPGLGSVSAPPLAFFSQTPLLEGVAGLLVSPSRGLFVYSPVLVLSLAGMALAWRQRDWTLRALMAGPPLVVLVAGKWFMWWGGHTYGPRVLADLTPILCFFLVPLRDAVTSSRLARTGFIVLAAASIAIHAIGAFLYDGRWDATVEVDRRPGAVWSWRGGQLAHYAAEAATLASALLPAPAGSSAGAETSATAPGALAVRYGRHHLDPVVFAGGSVALEVSVTNTGQAVWLARAPGDRGAVRLGWRFERAGIPAGAGRLTLAGDVEPGGSARFTGRITAPPRPGEYRLVVDLVSELVTWFADRGSPPLAWPVHVLSADPVDVLAAQPAPGPGPITVAAAVDRARYGRGDPIRVRIDLRNVGRARNLDAYAVVRGGGDLVFLDGHSALRPPGARWAPWVRGLPLPSQVATSLAVPGGELGPGDYTAYAILTEPESYAVIAVASAAFSIRD